MLKVAGAISAILGAGEALLEKLGTIKSDGFLAKASVL
jgi:hypothetical protein